MAVPCQCDPQKRIIAFEKSFFFGVPMNIQKDWKAKLESVYSFMLKYTKITVWPPSATPAPPSLVRRTSTIKPSYYALFKFRDMYRARTARVIISQQGICFVRSISINKLSLARTPSKLPTSFLISSNYCQTHFLVFLE